MYDLISLGLLCTDINVSPVTPAFFERDSMHVDMVTMPGGDGCNVVLNAAALGLSAALVSKVGADPEGAWLTGYLEQHGVSTRWIGVSEKCGSAKSLVMTEPGGERHFLTTTDIFREISPGPLTDDVLSRTRFLTVNSFFRIPLIENRGGAELLARAQSLGVRTAMDVMVCRTGNAAELMRPLLPHLDYFMPSYAEAVQITGERDPERMAGVLRSTGVKNFIVKLGSDGCYATDFHRAYRLPAFVVPRVASTVGAGDAFFAGFIAAVLGGKDLPDAARFASAAAALTVGVPGATGGIRSFDQVERAAAEGLTGSGMLSFTDPCLPGEW